MEDMRQEEGQQRSWLSRLSGWVNENILPTMRAWGRQGAKEAAQALKAFPDSIHPVEEIGMPGNPTQMTVNQEQGNVFGKPDAGRDAGYEAWLDQRAKEASQRQPEPNAHEREL